MTTEESTTAETDELCKEAEELLGCLDIADGGEEQPSELTRKLQQQLERVDESIEAQEKKAVRACVLRIVKLGQLLMASEKCAASLEVMRERIALWQRQLQESACGLSDLQLQSVSLSRKMQNRQQASDALANFLDEMMLSEKMVHALTSGAYSPDSVEYIEQVYELFGQRERIRRRRSEGNENVLKKTEELLNQIIEHVLKDVYAFALTKIASLRRPMALAEPVHVDLLKIRRLFEHLRQEQPDLADKVLEDYVDTVSKTTYTYVCLLDNKLNKLRQPERTWNFDASVSKSSMSAVSLFCMASRDGILNLTDLEGVLIPHLAKGKKFPVEMTFRSLHLPLTDISCREYTFIRDMFSAGKPSFFAIFDKTFSYCYHQSKLWTAASNDVIGQLLCMHIVFRLQVMAHDRGVPVLQNFHQSMLSALQKRALQVIEKHCEQLSALKEGADGGLKSAGERLISRHYPELLAAITVLDERLSISEQVSGAISRLADAFLDCVNELAARPGALVSTLKCQQVACGIIESRLENTCENHPLAVRSKALLDILVQRVTLEVIGQTRLRFLAHSENGLFEAVNLMRQDWKSELDDLLNEFVRTFSDFNLAQQTIQHCLKVLSEGYCTLQRNMQEKNVSSESLPSVSQFVNELKRFRTGL